MTAKNEIVIALLGQPNSGKSTLFNRLTRTRDAIVGDLSGLTRDRQYGEAKWQGRTYIVIDTGGISVDEEGIDGWPCRDGDCTHLAAHDSHACG